MFVTKMFVSSVRVIFLLHFFTADLYCEQYHNRIFYNFGNLLVCFSCSANTSPLYTKYLSFSSFSCNKCWLKN